MKLIKRISSWFKTKKEMMDLLNQMNDVIEKDIMELVSQIELLDQEKIYYFKIKDIEEREKVELILRKVQNNMKWTLPKIMIISNSFNELSHEDIKEIKKLGDKNL